MSNGGIEHEVKENPNHILHRHKWLQVVCSHTHAILCVHPRMCSQTRTCIRVHTPRMRTRIRTNACKYMHAHVHTRMRAHTRTLTHTLSLALSLSLSHTHTHTRACIHTHAHTHQDLLEETKITEMQRTSLHPPPAPLISDSDWM